MRCCRFAVASGATATLYAQWIADNSMVMFAKGDYGELPGGIAYTVMSGA